MKIISIVTGFILLIALLHFLAMAIYFTTVVKPTTPDFQKRDPKDPTTALVIELGADRYHQHGRASV